MYHGLIARNLKRLFSSVFVLLILLNVMGYYGLFLGLQYQNAREMTRKIDAGAYHEDEAVNLKIPYQSPYSSEFFERVDGDFEQNGQVYRLIKQRLYRDTFHIVYLKDKTGTALKAALSDYVKTFSEQSSDEDPQNVIIPIFIKEYFARTFSIQQRSPGWEQYVRKESHSTVFIESFTSCIVHPPERIIFS